MLVCCALMGAASTAWAHEGGLGNEVMWSACDGRKVDDHCAFENMDHDVFRGTCQAMTNALVCVRNQPIERAASALPTHQHEQAPGTSRDTGRWWPWMAGGFVWLVGGLAAFKMGR